MAHYISLRDYHFTADVDDIRGAIVYDRNGETLGKVKDVIFNHQTGEIRYLVVDMGRWKILVPSGRVFRSVADGANFETSLSRSDADQLPEFDGSALKDEKGWADHDRMHEDYWKKYDEQYMKEYEALFEERGGVMHRKESDRIVTPEPEELPPSVQTGGSGRQALGASELFPQRLENKFAGLSGPMFTDSYSGTPIAETVRRPSVAGESTLDDEPQAANPRWAGFQESVRKHAGKVRSEGSCTCSVAKIA